MLNRRPPFAKGTHRIWGALAALGASGLLVAAPAFGDQFPIDLVDGADARIDGAAALDNSGGSVAGAGDVNGDGYDDLLIGAPWADNNGRTSSGSAYVVFGNKEPANVDLNDLGENGFRIDGAADYDETGYSVAGAGDVNGDGYDDILVGAPAADNHARPNSGSTYVVYGGPTALPVDLADLGTRSFPIDGAATYDNSGASIAGAGDVNGDGYDDILIGAPWADASGRLDAGSSYLVYGSELPSKVDLADLGQAGFRVDGATASDHSGASVAGSGDVNGDGYDDVVIGANLADYNARSASGSSYVVYGGKKPSDVDLAALGDNGFVIHGAATDDQSGSSVAAVGDVNADGSPDLLIGAPYADLAGRTNAGASYVVYGSKTPGNVDLATLGDRGFAILGAAAYSQSGRSIAGTGDINGDGFPDLLVGAATAAPVGRTAAGSSHVVYGNEKRSNVDLATLGDDGFRIDGAATGDKSGSAVAGAGDVNADGSPDLLIGAPLADNRSRADSGSTYLILETPPYYTTPGAPTGVTGTPGNGQVQLAWTAPASDGGAAITGYRIELSTGGAWTVAVTDTGSTATSATVTGLTNGTGYTFRVAAINQAGTGPASDPSGPITPRTVPGAITSVRGSPGDQLVQLSWTTPASDGGAAITGYQIEVSVSGGGGPWTTAIADTGSPATDATITGLTNGTTYYFRIRAINSAGVGPPSGPLPVKPRTAPNAPTGVTGTPGDQQVQLAWTTPSADGGAPITNYRIDTKAGDGPWTSIDTGSTSTTHTVTGLTNGTAYEFRVAAINQAGPGTYSDPAGPYTPATTPAAPTGLTGTPGNGQVQLSWTAPTDNGGTPLTGYWIDIKAGDGPWTSIDTGNTGTTHTVTGLTNGTAYQFRVAALNAVGTGTYTSPAGPYTPTAPVTPPPPPVTPAAALAVTARNAGTAVHRKGRARLVRAISVGPGQAARITVKVKPKRARKKITITKTATTVKVRTRKPPRATITVSITASGPGVTPTTWTRSWKVR